MIKYSCQNHLKEGRFDFGLQLQRTGIYYDRECMAAGGWSAKLAGHILRVYRKQREQAGSGACM